MANNDNDKYKNELNNLLNSIGDSLLKNNSFAKEFLQDLGVDPLEIEQEGSIFIKKLQGQVRLEEGKTAQSKFQELVTKVRFEGKKLSDDSRETIARFISGDDQKKYALNFRKLTDLREDDFKEIQSEIELLKILEKINADS